MVIMMQKRTSLKPVCTPEYLTYLPPHLVHGKLQGLSSSQTSFDDGSLLSKLKIPPNDASFEPLHPLLLRKYIGYAKKYVYPT
jgi:hypothetical protein